jgi:hypothetical protein
MLIRGLALLGVGCGLVFAYTYLRPSGKLELLPVETTVQIAREIKHHVFQLCINFVECTKEYQKQLKKEGEGERGEIMTVVKNKLVELYEVKQALILNKFEVDNAVYKNSLNKYKDDL